MRQISVRQMSICALMCALLCILGPLAIPIGPVPLSLTLFVLFLSVEILGMKLGTLSFLLYLLLGFFGLPVFSGYAGGAAKLLGPTGGYLFGMIFCALCAGFFLERFPDKPVLQLLGMLIGLLLCYLFGTLWLRALLLPKKPGFGLWDALMMGVLPFIPGDLCKIGLAFWLGRRIRRSLPASLSAASQG